MKLLTDDDDEERKLLIHIAFSLTDKSKVTFLVILHCRIPPPVPEASSERVKRLCHGKALRLHYMRMLFVDSLCDVFHFLTPTPSLVPCCLMQLV